MNTKQLEIDITAHKRMDLAGGGIMYCFTPQELRKIGASQFKEKDVIRVSKYYIHIEYGQYDIPSLNTWIEDNNFRPLDCTPRCGTPYYIDNFKCR